MHLWIVDDDEEHLNTLKLTFTRSRDTIKTKIFSSLEDFHTQVLRAQERKITPPDLVIADYDFKREGNWISYLKKYFRESGFPFRYMILSQIIEASEILEIKKNDPNSLYVRMKEFDKSFQKFISLDNLYSNIMGDLISASTNPELVKKKYAVPLDMVKGKTNEVLNQVILEPGLSKSKLCLKLGISQDSFNKMKSRLNQKIKPYHLAIISDGQVGYHLRELTPWGEIAPEAPSL